jgi:hypothetical protein
MHHLRQEREAPRGLRPRLLARLAALAAALPVLALLALLAGCPAAPGTLGAKAAAAKAPAPASGPAAASAGAWLQLQSGVFQAVVGPAAAPPVPRLPWTVQARVADLALVGPTLFCAINGYGLAEIGIDAEGAPIFIYHADPMIFAHRTITTLVPRADGITVHLYYNALLNDAAPQDLALSPVSLVTYLALKSDYGFLVPPFQRKNPDWEAVGFAPASPDQYDFEWKRSDAFETTFAYTSYRADTQVEQALTREAYIAALALPLPSGAADERAAFFDACRREIGPLPEGGSLQFVVRGADGAVRRQYRSELAGDTVTMVPVFELGAERLALLPGGRVLAANSEPGSASRIVDLPELPRGFRYTELAQVGGMLAVAWEEISFTDVGRAGLLLITPSR